MRKLERERKKEGGGRVRIKLERGGCRREGGENERWMRECV